jgi:hypothetical protein
MITAAQGGQAIKNMARTYGLDAQQVEGVLGAIIPEFSRVVARNTLNRAGVADIVRELGNSDTQAALAPGASLNSPDVVAAGNDILGTLLGSKHASRGVAARAARETGVSESVIRQMLPAIAAMAMGGVAKQSRGALDEILGQLGGLSNSPLPLPGEQRQPPHDWNTPDPAPTAPSAPRPNGDVGRHSPLPIPGDNIPDMRKRSNPYDDLSDVIRRGGVRVPGGEQGGGSPGGSTGGGSLDNVIRDILGGAFGFQNKGIVSWIIQYVVLRYGWRIVQFVLRRLMGGR